MIEIVIYNIDSYCGKDGAIYMYKHPDPQVKDSTTMIETTVNKEQDLSREKGD